MKASRPGGTKTCEPPRKLFSQTPRSSVVKPGLVVAATGSMHSAGLRPAGVVVIVLHITQTLKRYAMPYIAVFGKLSGKKTIAVLHIILPFFKVWGSSAIQVSFIFERGKYIGTVVPFIARAFAAQLKERPVFL